MASLTINTAVLDYTSDGWIEYKKWLNGTYASLAYAWVDEGSAYAIIAIDGSVYRTCSINKAGADGTDFATNFMNHVATPTLLTQAAFQARINTFGQKAMAASTPVVLASDQAALSVVASPTTQRATYVVEVALAGANNKNMISIFNPAASGKIIKLREVWAVVPSSTGATVIIPFELRHATAITTGTTVTPKPLDSVDPAASAVVRQAPTGITDATDPKWWTWLEQINTAQGSTDAMVQQISDGSSTSELRSITLHEGEGCYLRQIASNTSTFRMGMFFTEQAT